MGKLDDKIAALSTDLDGLTAEVTAAVADITTLKGQIGTAGEVVTQEQLDALDAIGTRLTDATAALKAGE